ncbi:COG4315 family predicted lipoprotein [Actinokineospora sp. 24-640]
MRPTTTHSKRGLGTRCAAAALAAVALLAAGCSEPEVVSDETLVPIPVPAPTSPTPQPERVGAADLPQGGRAVDGRGHTLYVYAKDTVADGKEKAAKSACVDSCAKTWTPLLTVTGMPVALPGIDPRALGVLVRPDKTKQITLAGRPLYLHVGDTGPQQETGKGKDADWTVATPSA